MNMMPESDTMEQDQPEKGTVERELRPDLFPGNYDIKIYLRGHGPQQSLLSD